MTEPTPRREEPEVTPAEAPTAADSPAPEPVHLVALDDGDARAALAALDPVTAAGLEALLFLADEPQDVRALADVLELDVAAVDGACQGLALRHREEQRGTEVRRAAGGWRMYSSALARPVLERWALAGRTGRLTQAALETLAVIAYKQPIGRQEVGEIRGVNADGAVRSLVARGLVAEVGRDDGPGQALLYGTTTTFLERLGLDDLSQLPPMTDFLPEHAAPDEPELSRLKEVRRTLAAGGELPTGGLREAATKRFGDVRARLAGAGGADAAPAAALAEDRHLDDDDALPPPVRRRGDRPDETAAMDALTDQLEAAARNAVDRLRQAVTAGEERDRHDDEVAADAGPDDGAATAADAPRDEPTTDPEPDRG
ncbi:SMC-Scp complex subunit ScpB [Nitriliruptoraceae bacterium ZYF776]|nr:SMC-Scp complex subunit ScpB [Profundirhabdus halotolerans]